MAALTGVVTVGVAISGYGNSTIWLIICAFLLARAFIKSGLGRRISFLIIKAIGKSSLTLGYAITLSDFVISPATPSSTAPIIIFGAHPRKYFFDRGWSKKNEPDCRAGSYILSRNYSSTPTITDVALITSPSAP